MNERSKRDTMRSIPTFVLQTQHRPPKVSAGGVRVASSVEAATSDPNDIRGVEPFFAGPDLEFDLLPFG